MQSRLYDHDRGTIFTYHFRLVLQGQVPQIDLIPEDIQIQHPQSFAGKRLSGISQAGDKRNGTVLLDLGKQRRGIFAEAQHPGVGNIILGLTGLKLFLGHIQ